MANNQKILVVDDESDIVELISYNLTKEGYQVYTASNGKEAIKVAKEVFPDLIILDVMMPEMDGIEACRLMRSMPEFKQVFMVFLTARSEEYSEIAGFHVGADDYIAKPIKPRALMSRINAILRRNTTEVIDDQVTDKLEIADLVIDRDSFLVFRGDEKFVLAKKEFELLYLLASKPNKVFTREQILKAIWEDSVVVTNRTIDVHIRKLREKIGDSYVTTVKGVGYKFELE
ncbi:MULTISPECIES: response regulator transcription factor [Sphingobacterium]|uniref:Phosphate regulon transcriptional regulatory protein PhoB n=1 Tax=Sphingobacterium cellulitidis TaxID=1768011 RepID=A0A8H9G030_9SPHI|nr:MULTISPECIES: response regulator transcription factor [Sphingobacterium]MBA8987215.1 two-component system alkaline phosphatase synthesis response regulator PhoP [Sphingobacterium soli]OYD40836.1 DNA-binding response regulator [Sphingobacterium cellulitidis]OYD46596.1 DNA-binding response regulator [Sphingobacterium cellulitidis]WFB64576.1 response regulator transcription factor [Sphingobacterium sp. WM]GGE17306.1 DNA-binding response regulator [Sphingobacterium soli]